MEGQGKTNTRMVYLLSVSGLPSDRTALVEDGSESLRRQTGSNLQSCKMAVSARIEKKGVETSGYLVSVDSYMNLQLASTEEFIDGQFTGNLGEVLIRCNNVLYLRGVPEDEDAVDEEE
ncbi:unnamed protein product [Calypogeia fissa]